MAGREFVHLCQGCPGWQPVDAEQEEEEEVREQAERERAILAALKDLGKARAATVATAIGAKRSNISSKLQELWKQRKIRMEVIDYVPYYFLKEQGELDAQAT